MTLSNTLTVYIFSLFVSVIIYVDLRSKFEKHSLQDRLFTAMLLINSGLLVFAAFTIAYDGQAGNQNRLIVIFTNTIVYIGTTTITALWVLYSDNQIYHDRKRTSKQIIILSAIVGVHALLSITSSFTGWFFIVDASNVYHRSFLFPLHAAINLGLLFYTIGLIYYNRKNIKSRYYPALLFFAVPPMIFSMLQTLFYGLELIWSGITLSLLIVYFNIQNHTMSVDYLTGAYNRRELDIYLQDKINESDVDKSFSAIMLDLNDFKMINDTYGHFVGDVILKDSVRIIESIMKYDDFIARFGGDEFIIIMDVQSEKELESKVARINDAIEQYNKTNVKPYTLSLCMGYAIYDRQSGLSAADFLKYVDTLMYQNKRKYKTI